MRKILLLLLITMLISCDIAIFDEKLSLNGENPFLNPTEITRDADEDDTLSFIVLTDAHLNREYRDSGIHRNEDNLFYFLDQNKDDIDAILLLGDMIDDGVEMDYERMHVFLDDLRSHTRKDIQIIYALGNHEPNKGSTEEDWEKEFDISSMEAFIIEDTMIYKLNSAYRIFGSDQINALKYAMRENSEKYGTRYNFVITHVPLGAKGLNQRQVVWTHAVRNAIMPVVTVMGPLVAAVLTGAVVVENIFSIPGLGRYFVQSVTSLNYTMIAGTTVFYGAFLIFANLVVDIIYGLIDPRIKLTGRKE